MSNALGDLLAGRNFEEPPEIQHIKDFVIEAIGVEPQVSITTASFIVRVPSAAAAGTLRMRIFQLQEELGSERRVVIRIG